MTYIGPGADDADIGQLCLPSELADPQDAFVCNGSSDGTDHEDLIALTQIALCDVLSSRV